MKKMLLSTLALSLILSMSLASQSTVYASTSSVMSNNVSVVSLGKDMSNIKYANSVGYYTEKEIPQGLEFTILGEDDRVSSRFNRIFNANLNTAVTLASSGSDYYNPSTSISKVSGNSTLKGVWWGGIVNDIFTAGGGAVASVTIAKTNNTQSKASVKPGLTSGWVSSDWKDTGVRADVLEEVGISGNKAKWDLRDK